MLELSGFSAHSLKNRSAFVLSGFFMDLKQNMLKVLAGKS
jgi:hypothetical protein